MLCGIRLVQTDDKIFAAVDATWPAHKTREIGGWIIREGRGGGQRVSAASGTGDIGVAEKAMDALGQDHLFMIRGDQAELDTELAVRGYVIKDPVNLLVCDAANLVGGFKPKLEAIFAEFPMPMLAEIWAEGGIGPARLDVMQRANCTKTFVMGRIDERASAAAFVAASSGICMAHAVEVLARERRRGVAERMMRAAAWWGLRHGAETFCVLTTQANTGAQALYRKLGMETAAQYHYRIKK
jgi:GNAT superfamily N-acetyltransferase